MDGQSAIVSPSKTNQIPVSPSEGDPSCVPELRPSSSYRDEGSRQIAAGISRNADGPVVPDLAFSLPVTRNQPVMESGKKPIRVGVSPIAFARPGLWPTERIATYTRYMTELSRFVASLLESGMSVILFSSSTPDDQTFQDLRDRVSSQIEKEDLVRLSSCDVMAV